MVSALYLYIFLETLAVAYLDFKYRKISNLWSILHIFLSIALFFIFKDLFVLDLNFFKIPAIIFSLGFFLFLIKKMGGGDAKYLSTLFLIIPNNQHENFLTYLLIATIIVSGIRVMYNLICNYKEVVLFLKTKDPNFVSGIFGKKFPYAPVILLGWIILGCKTYL